MVNEKVPIDQINLNTMSNPIRGFMDETHKIGCLVCGNWFRTSRGMAHDPRASLITRKHLELCKGDPAVTLSQIDHWFRHEGGRATLEAL